MKKKLRQLVIDGKIYLWRFIPGYTRTGDCRDLFTAYLQHTKNCPLQVHFRTWEDAIAGGPLRMGGSLHVDGVEVSGINLNTPGDAAWLIRQGLSAGWEPESGQPFIIKQGERLLIAKKRDNEL